MRAFEDVCAYARTAGLLVLADGKRGDIGSTSRAYAAAYLEPRDDQPPLADAMTVSPYLGRDSVEPLLAACRREGAGIFCLVKTSNEGVADIQDLALSDGRPLWQHVARLVAEWGEDLVGERGLSSVGAVVGATHPRAIGEARRAPPAGGAPAPRRRRPGRERRPTSRPPSRAGRRAPSSPPPARSSTPSGRPTTTGASAAAAEAARLKSEVWTASGW